MIAVGRDHDFDFSGARETSSSLWHHLASLPQHTFLFKHPSVRFLDLLVRAISRMMKLTLSVLLLSLMAITCESVEHMEYQLSDSKSSANACVS